MRAAVTPVNHQLLLTKPGVWVPSVGPSILQVGKQQAFCPSLALEATPVRGSLAPRPFPRLSCAGTQEVEVTDAEKEAWLKRKAESEEAAEDDESTSPVPMDEWRWTLNWDVITSQLLVGSCPRSPEDIDRLADEAKITAIVNLQSDLCFDALKIPFPELRGRAVERGVWLVRVPIRDFDHGDQSMMLPEAVRMVNLLVTKGHRVYVHCTAGINRANLVVVAYLYFIQGLRRDEAVNMVKDCRPIANPYLDCLSEAKRRILDGRNEEVTVLATEIYEARLAGKHNGTQSSDWSGAQATAIARTFRKYLEVDLVKMQLGLLGAIYCRTRDGFSFSYPESIDLSNWNRIMRTGLIEIEQDVLTTTMGVFLSDEDDVELGEDEEEDDFPAIDTLSLTAAEESSVGRKGSGTQRREEEDVAELLQSEDAQKVKQQLTALLEESRQLSAALAQWQAAKEAADLQVARFRDRIAESPTVTTNGQAVATNGVATSGGAVTSNGNAIHTEAQETNGHAVEEDDGADLECDVITRQCKSASED